MRHLPLVTALVLATGIAVVATVVEATVKTPAQVPYTTCTPATLS